ncbi:hypothetical protein [Pedobacter glucosidilyticus]|uniref:hypothetical protein n=1 Tax=Pedobacter glucosidilyticus TaxID=1122941 RepID=UPI0026EF5A00|nr:hypothetical protein [Pedobacter glucosidilyticus]
MRDNATFQNGILKISYPNYGKDGRNYCELFDFLGDFDIITANEIGQDVIVMSEIVFMFSNFDEGRLKRESCIELEAISSLKEFVDAENPEHREFLEWYYN